MILVEIHTPTGEALEIAATLLRMAWVYDLSYQREHFPANTAAIGDGDTEIPESMVMYRLVPERTFILVRGPREAEFMVGVASLRNAGKITTLSNDKELMKP